MPIDVRESAEFVVAQSRSVRIDPARVPDLARELATTSIPAWDDRHHFRDGPGRTITYLLLVDALNFCFFPEPTWEVIVNGERLSGYFALTSALREAFEEGSTVLDPAHLAEITEDEAAGLLHGAVRIGEIPLLAERTAILQEVGKALGSAYAERPERLVEEAAGSAERLIRSLIARFPSFRDEATYGGERIGFYKRAQILVADLCGCFGGTGPGRFHDLPTLTAFADYKLPQILRHVGVVAYAPDLAARVDRRAWIDAGSPEEVEIRAATIVAVERLKEALQALGRPLLAIEIDWLLWQAAQRRPGMWPHHRTLTTRY